MYRDVWERLAGEVRPIIIYGTGNGADKVLDQMHKRGIRPHGIMASDGFIRGQSFRGFEVKSLAEHLRSADDPVIVLAFGSQRSEVIENILSIAERHTVLCADVPVYGDNVFDRSFFEEHRAELEKARSLLAEEQSRRVFDGVVSFKLHGELHSLTEIFTDKQEVFGSILRLGENESYLDLGAYRGDTIAEFLRETGGQYSHITALEPDRRTYLKLCEYAGAFPETQLFNMGIWCEDCDLVMDSALGRGSSLNAPDSAKRHDPARHTVMQTVPVTKIDTLYKKRHLTYLKMDVEGAEERAILGGSVTIARDRPKLNISLYHRSEDIFRLPLLIDSISSGYRMYMRQHPHLPSWDLNLYAMP